MTGPNAPTAEQQLDALVRLLLHSDYWCGFGGSLENNDLSLFLYENTGSGQVASGPAAYRFDGTRDEVLAKLIAFQVAERLS